MTNEPETPAHRLWNEQPQGDHRISLDDVRERARRFDKKVRRGRQLAAVLVGLLTVANAIQAVWPGRNAVERSGDILIVMAFVLTGYQYRRDTRHWSQSDGPGAVSCVDFYRALLIRERDFSGQSRRYILPFVPGVGLALTGGILKAPSGARMFWLPVLGIGLFAALSWWNAWTARRLQREIERIDPLCEEEK